MNWLWTNYNITLIICLRAGLVSYAFTKDLARGMRLVDSLDTGMSGINTGLVSNAAAPFGGVKQSGIGREGGAEGIEEYLETRYVLIPNA